MIAIIVIISILHFISSCIPGIQSSQWIIYGIAYCIVLVIGAIFSFITLFTDKSGITHARHSKLFASYLIVLFPLWIGYGVGVILLLTSEKRIKDHWLLWFRMIVSCGTLAAYFVLVLFVTICFHGAECVDTANYIQADDDDGDISVTRNSDDGDDSL